MGAIASQNTSLTIVYATVNSDADKKTHQSSVSLAFVWGVHRGPVNSPHKWPVTRKMFPFDDVIMGWVNHTMLLSASEATLIHWGRVRHICASKITIIGSSNGLSHGRCQAIFRTIDGILLVDNFGTKFCEILIGIYIFSFRKIYDKLRLKRQPFCPGRNVWWISVKWFTGSIRNPFQNHNTSSHI